MPLDFIEEDEDKTGNQKAKPRYEKSQNPVAELLSTHLNFKETSFADSSYWSDSQTKPYNPDDLIQRNFDYSTYEEMLKDDQVSVCLQLKRDLVIASGFDIIMDSENEAEIQIKEELEKALKEYPEIPLMDSLEEMLTAYEYGFSISERVFQIKEDGHACLRFLKTRHPVTWLLHQDEKGNVIRYEQRGPHSSIDIDPENIIHYKVNSRFGNPYGRSDLRAAWQAWFIKKEIIKYYSIYLEKAASPTPVAKYDKNLPQQAVDDIFAAIKKLQTKTALAIPKDIELEFLETSNQGEAYVKGINLFNMFIGRSLLVPDLLGFQGSETSGGSYSLGKDQMNVFFRHINKRRSQLEDLVNKYIIQPTVLYNYGYIENCPRFKLKPMNDEEAIDLAKLWLEAVKGRVYIPNEEEINHFRGLCKFPEGEVEIEEPMEVSGESEEESKEEDDSMIEEEEQMEMEEKGPEKKEFVFDKTPGDFSKKVNFAAAEKTMIRLQDAVIAESFPILAASISDLVAQIRRKKIVQNQDIAKFDDVKIKFGSKLKSVLKKHFLQAYKESKAQAQTELLKGNNFAAPLPDEAFLKFLEDETFQYIGDWEYQISKATRLKLVEAIKDGKPLSTIEGILADDGLELSQTSIERYSRTKLTEVMNRARLSFFDSSGVVAAYQYSAVLDDRTTEICSGLHGKIFEKGDEPIPPLHFNCRSLLVPITKYEQYEADTTVDGVNINKFIEDNKGEGFPTK